MATTNAAANVPTRPFILERVKYRGLRDGSILNNLKLCLKHKVGERLRGSPKARVLQTVNLDMQWDAGMAGQMFVTDIPFGSAGHQIHLIKREKKND